MAPSQGCVRATPTLQSDEPPQKVTYSRAGTPTAGGLLAVPPGKTNQISIALRAICSVISRIGCWAQLKNMPLPDESNTPTTAKEKGVKKRRRKRGMPKKRREGRARARRTRTNRQRKKVLKPFGSHPEALRLAGSRLVLKRRRPLDLRNKAFLDWDYQVRCVFQLFADLAPLHPVANQLSVDSAKILSRNRSCSVLSTESSLRQVSLTSTDSRASSGSSAASVRWDEQGLETVREQRKKEREAKRQIEEKSDRRSSKRVTVLGG